MSTGAAPEAEVSLRDERRARTGALVRGFQLWTAWPALVHLGCVLLLAAVPAVRWWSTVSETEELIADEVPYFAAFERVAAGGSPFDEPGYLYPSFFAHLGAWSMEHLGQARTDNLLQAINLLGLAVVVWCAMAWLPWHAGWRWLAGGGFILLAPQVRYSVGSNNISLAVAGMIVGGLLLVPRRPLAAGLLLGGSVALKPVAPAALGCLLFARRDFGGRRNVVAAGVALVVAATLVLAFPGFETLLARVDSRHVLDTVSLHRFPGLLGLDVSLFWVSALALGAPLASLLRPPLGAGPVRGRARPAGASRGPGWSRLSFSWRWPACSSRVAPGRSTGRALCSSSRGVACPHWRRSRCWSICCGRLRGSS